MNIPSSLPPVEWPLLAAFYATSVFGSLRWLVWAPAGLMMVVGVFLVRAGIAGFLQRLSLVWRGNRAPATVLGVADSVEAISGEDGPLPVVFHVPRIEFTDDQGRTHVVSEPGNVRFSAKRFQAGDMVTVIYPPENPEDCVLDRFADKWAFSLAVFAIGVVLTLVPYIVAVRIVRL
jgi:hypothetical protein